MDRNRLENWAFPLGRERDACGVGAVSVGRSGVGRLPLDLALRAVGNFEHRGACMPDGTGDGTGFLMDIPGEFFAREIRRAAPEVDAGFIAGDGWGVATLFMPRDLDAERVDTVMRKAFGTMGITAVMTREVPMREDFLGVAARRAAPRMTQTVMRWEERDDKMATLRFLFMAQRRLEEAFSAEGLPVYITSFSDRTLVYKGMMDGRQFPFVFPDLYDDLFTVHTVVFHRRFATNTIPNWNMCQPFRLLCHNGEINTIENNRHAVHIWERYVRSCGLFDADWPASAIVPGQSDSADLDGAVQAYHAEGRSLAYTVAILMPPSWENRVRNLSPEMKAFFEFHKRALGGLGAWEGPAAIVAYDGHQLVCSLDRMGLRPLRVSHSQDGVFMASSENGIFEHHPSEITYRHQLTPGDIVRFNLDSGQIVPSADVYFEVIRETSPKLGTTFRETNARQIRGPALYGMADEETHPDLAYFRGRLGAFLRAYGWDSKLKQESTDHLIDVGKEDIYCMGFDRAMPFLSVDGPPLYRFFLQRFALVTNPPIDPYREGRDMSLVTYLGRMPDVPPRTSPAEIMNLRLKSPVLTDRTALEISSAEDIPARTIDLSFQAGNAGDAMRAELDRVIGEGMAAARDGAHVLLLSDKGAFARRRWPLPATLATAALNDRLTEEGLRPLVSIVVQSGEIGEGHDVAVLLSLGASAVHPHALFRYAAERARRQGRPVGAAIRNVLEGLEESLRKIMSKMGIATIQGYQDSCLHEAVGLGPDVMAYLKRVPSRIGGLGFDELADDLRHRWRHAAALDELPEYDFDERTYSDPMRFALWEVALSGEARDWRRYQRVTDARRPSVIRDLLTIETPENAEPTEPLPGPHILRECVVTGGMSHGALTRNAHEAIAWACNDIGMLSNSGEGGEDRARNRNGARSSMRSRIRQVATGRFGVDAEYLVNADEIQIKMAQGAKPGEGGQLMSSKVTPEIAALRYCRPGINLISPPPHHDIYSIEDLKQLIYDLRAINPDAKVSVKLCAVTGIGTIAAGVVKAGADIIEIDGLEGSTGASPRSSLEHTGLPTELGLREVHLALSDLGIRDLIVLRAGGGVKTETDAVKYMLLGADQIAIATALMIAQGCVHCNLCHTGTCPTLIAGSLNKRAVYPGSGEHVKRFLLAFGAAIADQVARLGFSHPRELRGRVDLLRPKTREEIARNLQPVYGLDPERLLARAEKVDLSLFTTLPPAVARDAVTDRSLIDNFDHSVLRMQLDDAELMAAIDEGRGLERHFTLQSCNSVDFSVPAAHLHRETVGTQRLAEGPRRRAFRDGGNRGTELRRVLPGRLASHAPRLVQRLASARA
ncbi:MAG: glutamate synthase-related protein [Deltaproteobacteria bacterium]|nr:glutamate synthase-related protein [Deltaproteobacteria bacterium]